MSDKVPDKNDLEARKPLTSVLRVYKAEEFDPLNTIRTPGSIMSNALEPEDEFKSWYALTTDKTGPQIIEPPYNLTTLEQLCHENNALMPCIDAMVTNVVGTGYVIEGARGEDNSEGEEVDRTVIESVSSFFDQPWPGVSWLTLMKSVRRDVESVGNGFIEILRAANGQVVFSRHVSAKMVRLVSLSVPMFEEVEITRNGVKGKFTVQMRHRRFAQVVNGKPVYFREFGTDRDMDKTTGQFANKGEVVSLQLRATELIHFMAIPDVKTPYGVPRWITQLPSVLGSRKAEEMNLGFFDTGGVPPLMIMVQGGTLAEDTVKALQQHFMGSPNGKNKAVVLEAHSTSGDINGTNNVRVSVERFGAERQNDSMFEGYDTSSEERIRAAFRLPPIFTGKSNDYSFATAFASYTVAEAQVFKPERDEIDEVINLRLMPELNPSETLRYRSLDLSVKDATQQLKGLEMAAANKAITNGELVKSINEVTGLELMVADEAKDNLGAPIPEPLQALDGIGKPKATPVEGPVAKSAAGLDALADEILGFLDAGDTDSPVFRELVGRLGTMSQSDVSVLKGLMAMKSFTDISKDPEGLSLLNGCSVALLAARK